MELVPAENTKLNRRLRRMYEQNKLMLPLLPSSDDFLRTINCLFDLLKWIGVPIRGGYFVVTCCAIQLGLLICLEIGAIWKVIKTLAGWATYSSGNRSVVSRVSGAIFYGNAVVSLTLLWRLRPTWKSLSADWASTERTTGLYFPPEGSLRRKMISVIAIVFAGSLLEHSMSTLSLVGFECPASEFLERYVLGSHAFLIIKPDYDLRLGIVIFVINKTATALWNLQDLVIILISMGLTSRYRRLNRYVMMMQKSLVDGADQTEVELQTWRKLREAFVRQAALVRRVDQLLGALILLSNSNNFFFICLQLFRGIGGLGDTTPLIDKVYFGVSVTWLFVRAVSVVISASDIQLQSKKALAYLYALPERNYNVEVRRLENQLKKDFVALSGMGFFYMDRNMLLEVAAAIFKYELVLLEFDG